jgi:hypothetical protein
MNSECLRYCFLDNVCELSRLNGKGQGEIFHDFFLSKIPWSYSCREK